jgi:hypothetical protein
VEPSLHTYLSFPSDTENQEELLLASNSPPMNSRILARYLLCSVLALNSMSRADVITEWNNAALQAIRSESTPPPKASWFLAILHATMFDAVSRLYAGIHFRSANEDGLEIGVEIGSWTVAHFLQPKSNRARH